jgi:cytoskeletal protein CcmA (bactofilin family)
MKEKPRMKFGNRTSETAKPRSGDVNGFFGEGIEIRGDIRFKDTIRVDGRIQATIRSEGELILGPSGVIEGEVTVGSLVVSGRVKGTLRIKGRLEIHPGGRVEGEVLLARPGLIVHEGGVVEARVQMGTVKEEVTARDEAPRQTQERAALATGSV